MNATVTFLERRPRLVPWVRVRDVPEPRAGLLRRLLRHPTGRLGLALGAFLILAVAIGPVFVGHDPVAVDHARALKPPGSEHLLGTDRFGRDQLARILVGGRLSLGAALMALAGTLVISVAIGLVAGLSGRLVDAVLTRIVDVALALPGLVLALAIVGVFGPGLDKLLLALVVSSWAYYARLARSFVLGARERPDVQAARMAGIGWVRITMGHVLPGVLAQLGVVATLNLGGVVVAIASLSFLGLGVQPPAPEWGAMLNDARLYFITAPWLLLAPATAIFLAVMAFNLVGDALRDVAALGGNR